MLKSFVSDTSRRDLWNSAFIMVKRSSLPSLLEWDVRPAGGKRAAPECGEKKKEEGNRGEGKAISIII